MTHRESMSRPPLCRILIAVLAFWVISPSLLFAQGTNVTFGKNRVQYHDFTWSYYQSDNFITYYYLGGQEIGQYTAQIAEAELPDIENILDYKINNRIEILVYNDITDLNMSNIGIGLDFINIGGTTKIIGNKIFVHFTGDHLDLKRQIREGIGQVLLNNMIFGGSLQEVVQNAVLLNLPEWFVTGLISYIGERWSMEHDNRLRDGISSGKFRKFNKLTGTDATLAGHSFWFFVEERNGKEAIPNLLYLTRINRSLENGFLFVLGYTYKEAIARWFTFFEQRYTEEAQGRLAWADSLQIERKHHKNRTYRNLRLHPDGQQIAFASYDMGKWRVHLHNTTTGKTATIAKGGFKTRTIGTDHGYPLFDFDPSGQRLLVFYEKRDVIQMLTYELADGKKQTRNLEKFQRIVDFNYTNNPTKIVLSAVNRGQSDIYLMDTRSTTVTPITNDPYDDLHPSYVSMDNRQGIIWSSNRPKATITPSNSDSLLATGHFDLFFLNENGDGINAVINLTNTPYLNEWYPQQIDEEQFTYLSPANGLYNQFTGHIDTTFSHDEYVVYYQDSIRVYRNLDYPMWAAQQSAVIDSHKVFRIVKDTAFVFPTSNWNRGILEQDINQKRRQQLLLVQHNNQYQFHLQSLPDTLYKGIIPGLTNTAWRQRMLTEQRLREIERLNTAPALDNSEASFLFQSEFEDNDTSSLSFLQQPDEGNSFRPTKVKPYRVKFSTDYVLSQVDNSIIMNQYQNFAGYGPVFQPPPLGGLITLSVSDLMEDYRFTGGFRIPTSFSGSEYFLKYEDLKKRLDKQYLFYRRTDISAYDFRPLTFQEVGARQHTNYFEAQLKYPIDILRSIRARFGYRNYKVNFLSRDPFSLELPSYIENWLSGTIEYVYDDTYPVMLNIMQGMRYRIYYEYHKQFDLQLDPDFSFDPSLGTMHVVGFDFRHYQKLHRQITWANRIAGGTSFGSKKLIYYLGGIDNWLVPRFNEAIDVNFDNNYAFQTLATNLRGFTQNIRNGNTYVAINSELRIPVFAYLFNTPIRSELIRNFQVIGFGDVGSAWEGPTPFSDENPFNTEELERGPVRVSTQYFRNPIVAGYGLGIRTLLFGYFVRVDRAWGIDSGVIQDPMWYFSFSLDF